MGGKERGGRRVKATLEEWMCWCDAGTGKFELRAAPGITRGSSTVNKGNPKLLINSRRLTTRATLHYKLSR
ncbi:hypothetical protein E2C01_085675 [Portunus trituberculatus]|uniref:Uncharacterized protein n=1 Tax=Portunus trituberculatus TaxID=210409 RepID=A0A5B7JCK8_PORTR|nr:hypothetical protein [Portunus trituberculatus]